jgi:hypothetical protein
MPDRFRELTDTIPRDIRVHRTFPGPLHALTYHFSREASGTEVYDNVDRASSFRSALARFHSGVHRALNFILVPDTYVEWFPFALRRGTELIKKNHYDVLISASEPRTGHLAGYYIKKKSNIPWIADYGDPWIYPISPLYTESAIKKKLLYYTERKLLRSMDAVTFTADGTRRLYLEKYPFLDSDKTHIIKQGYDPGMISSVKEETPGGFRIVYCGSFYKNLRNPVNFFHAVNELGRDDIEVVIAGRINEFAEVLKKGTGSSVIQYRGFVSHMKSLSLQKGATVLLHIGTASDIQVPGKLFEYLGAGRPILCIKDGEKDFSAEIISKHKKGIIVGNNKDDIKQGILALYDLWKKNSLNERFNLSGDTNFSWHKGAEKLGRIIENM